MIALRAPLDARGERTSNGLGIITGNGQANTKWHSHCECRSEHIINSHGLKVDSIAVSVFVNIGSR